MYKITIHYVSPLSTVRDGDGFSGLELTRVKLNPRLLLAADSSSSSSKVVVCCCLEVKLKKAC